MLFTITLPYASRVNHLCTKGRIFLKIYSCLNNVSSTWTAVVKKQSLLLQGVESQNNFCFHVYRKKRKRKKKSKTNCTKLYTKSEIIEDINGPKFNLPNQKWHKPTWNSSATTVDKLVNTECRMAYNIYLALTHDH